MGENVSITYLPLWYLIRKYRIDVSYIVIHWFYKINAIYEASELENLSKLETVKRKDTNLVFLLKKIKLSEIKKKGGGGGVERISNELSNLKWSLTIIQYKINTL